MDKKKMAEWALENLRFRLDEKPGSFGSNDTISVFLEVNDGEKWVTISDDYFSIPDCD
jgi:hypothetical protein